MNGQKIDGQEVQVSLAKPPSNKHETNSQTTSKLKKNSSGSPFSQHRDTNLFWLDTAKKFDVISYHVSAIQRNSSFQN